MQELEDNFKRNGGVFELKKISEVFDIKKGKRLEKIHHRPGATPFIGSSGINNGVTDFIEQDPIFTAPAITISYNGSVGSAFYQDEDFWASDDINVLYLKEHKLKPETACYLIGALLKAGKEFSYTRKWNVERMSATSVLLPYRDNKLSLDFMQDYVRELEQDYVRKIDAFLKVAGLDDCTLTDEEKNFLAIGGGQGITDLYQCREFTLGDLFKASKGDYDLQQKDINGLGCYFINSGVENLGVKGRTDVPAKTFNANTITIDFWGNAYYRDFEYKLATHNHVFSLSGDVIKNREVGLFIISQMTRFPKIFSYNNMATWPKLKELAISLPADPEGNPDCDFMEQYIKAVEKLVIKDVIDWKNREIAAANQIIYGEIT